MKFVTEIEYDESTDECILPIPDEILDSLGWIEGDMLQWEYNDDCLLLKKCE
jgi:hypothetical protein